MRSERLPIGRSAVRIGLRVGPDGDFARLHRSSSFCLALEQMQIVLGGDRVVETATDHPLRVRHQDEVFYIRYAANETDAIDGRTITFRYGFHGCRMIVKDRYVGSFFRFRRPVSSGSLDLPSDLAR